MIQSPMFLKISPATAVDDDGSTTFTATVIEKDGKFLDGNAVLHIGPLALATEYVNRFTVRADADPADLALGENAVKIINSITGATVAAGAILTVAEAEE
jgi:hypothetical protein